MASKTTGKKGSEKKPAGKKRKETKEVVKMQVSADVIRRLVSKLEEKGI